MKKKRILFWISVAVVYCLLLLVLVVAESSAPESSINSFPQAIWYSLVTMTTVGYGDMYPVTVVGCAIGALFLLCSAGALTAVISIGVRWLTGSGLPRVQIKRLRGHKVFIFDQNDQASRLLSASIKEEEPEAHCIISALHGSSMQIDKNLYVPLSTSDILNTLKKRKEGYSGEVPTVVFTGADAKNRMSSCRECSEVRVVCESRGIPEVISDRILYYDSMELRAYGYWRRYPLALSDQKVVFIGFGTLGRAVLEHGLQRNILTPFRNISYTVFENGDDFMRDHHELGSSISLGEKSDSSDSLVFSSESWNRDPELIKNADRIIICFDNETLNLEIYRRLKTYFPTGAQIHIYCTGNMENSYPVFGTDEEIYTVENLFRPKIEQLAKSMHMVYKNSADYPVPAWEELSAFLRQSNKASAEHAAEKLRFLLKDEGKTEFTEEDYRRGFGAFIELAMSDPSLCREIEHNRWRRFHSMYNWKYAPVRDNDGRCHPLMVDFDKLQPDDQRKNDYAWELFEKI